QNPRVHVRAIRYYMYDTPCVLYVDIAAIRNAGTNRLASGIARIRSPIKGRFHPRFIREGGPAASTGGQVEDVTQTTQFPHRFPPVFCASRRSAESPPRPRTSRRRQAWLRPNRGSPHRTICLGPAC